MAIQKNGSDVYLYGVVGASWWDEGFTASEVVSALQGLGDVTVHLNSGGGDAFEGAAIHAVLAAHPGRVTVTVEGIAASAASLLAMAGDEIVMAEGALLMVHDPSMMTWGDADKHRRGADALDAIAETYARAYASRTKKTPAEMRAVMKTETWLGGAEAVEAGFADRVAERPAAEASAFPYADVYAVAPKALRVAALANGWRAAPTVPQAIAAKHEEVTMSDKTEAATAPAATAAPAVEMKADPSAAVAAAVAAERERALGIRRAVAAAKLDAEMADKLIAEGVSVADAHARVIDAWAAQAPTLEVRRPAEPVSAGRLDERQTLREGVAMALEAQLAKAAPADAAKARPWMAKGLVEMAADVVGDRGPLRTVADRERVLMSAFHTTSDFPNLLENVLNKSLLARYRQAEPTYRRIARRISFMDFRPHPMLRTGDFPNMRQVNESGEIQFGTIGESKESVSALSYAIGLRLSRQLLINDDLDSISQMLADRGRAVARFEDTTFYTMMLSASGAGPTLIRTNRAVFNTTDASQAGSGTTIDVAALSLGRAAIRRRTGLDGALLDLTPSILLVGPDRETVAQQVVAPIQADQVGQVNPFSGRLEVVVTARITGNGWYLFADPSEAPCFVYGYLSGYEAPRVRIEEPFGQQGVALTVEHDFGVGAVDFVGGWRNPGN